ncbi:hypothetical protein [Micromonospora sp. ATCC 39149]|uniref:Esterase-like activity of phytase family protein n=1 Tax=Micromonospora carbonacea TaxID=47853 RepID=A0A7D6CGI5_9ACTN|nr:hypothetical protein [Micromonospora sp. ATCC 39149]QLK00974.1 hypothetical protein HZU44_13860 [Micromonospora carbonacea]
MTNPGPPRHPRRRWPGVGVAAATVAAVVVAPGAAVADPVAGLAPTPGTPVCQIRDDRLTEISGLVATDDGFVVVNDGAEEESRRRIFFLDARCAVVRTVRYPSRPRDTEDLAVGADGTIWVADIGDNDRARRTVALWKLPPGASRPVLHRMTYPDGAHDAEALLVDGAGRPLIVTKQGGSAGLYRPALPLRAGGTVPLARVGQVRLPSTTTRNPYSFVGRGVVTGAASAPDGRRVVLRTYADAFAFDVASGDLVAALTTGRPSSIPLPDEPQGESVSFSRDGRSLLTVSETANQPPGTRPRILRYTLPPRPTPSLPRTGPAPAGTGRADDRGADDRGADDRDGDGGADDGGAAGRGSRDRAERGGTAPLLVGGVAAALALLALGMATARGARRGGR